MPDYVKAYAGVEPLLSGYDRELQRYSDLCNRLNEEIKPDG